MGCWLKLISTAILTFCAFENPSPIYLLVIIKLENIDEIDDFNLTRFILYTSPTLCIVYSTIMQVQRLKNRFLPHLSCFVNRSAVFTCIFRYCLYTLHWLFTPMFPRILDVSIYFAPLFSPASKRFDQRLFIGCVFLFAVYLLLLP